jgi:hypothetical protein
MQDCEASDGVTANIVTTITATRMASFRYRRAAPNESLDKF